MAITWQCRCPRQLESWKIKCVQCGEPAPDEILERMKKFSQQKEEA